MNLFQDQNIPFNNINDTTSQKSQRKQNTKVSGNFAVQDNQLNNKKNNQHSKVTSIIKRRTNNYDEDEDFGMVDNYSQRSNTYIPSGSYHSKQKDDLQEQINAAGSTIDMNFLHDINNECNYLITKFQDDYVSKRPQQNQDSSQLQHRQKSTDLSNKLPKVLGQINQDDILQQNSSSKIYSDQRSSKTVGGGEFKQQLETSDAKKVITPHTGKHVQSSGQKIEQKFIIKDDNQTHSNGQTLHHQYNSGAISNTDQSERVKTFDKQSVIQVNQANLNVESQNYIHDNETLSITVQNKDVKVFEDSSLKHVSSYHMDNNSKYSISDRQSHNIPQQQTQSNVQLNSHQDSQKAINNIDNAQQNKMTFRDNDNLQQVDGRNNYMLPLDDSNNQQDPSQIIQQNNLLNINEPTAQFDMQNFSALDRRIEGNSVDSSKDFSKFQDVLSQQTPYSQNHQMFGTTQRIGGVHQQQIYSDQDSNTNVLSNREKRYMNNQTDNDEQHQIDYNNHTQDDQYEEDQCDDDYEDDNNMPFSDNDNNQLNHQYHHESKQQVSNQQSKAILSHQPSNKGQLLFTNNQHIFKQENDSDDNDGIDHKQFAPIHQQNSKNQLAFTLPQDDDNEEQQQDNFDMPPQPPIQFEEQNLNDDIVYNRLPKKYFAQEDIEVKDANQVQQTIQQMRQDFIGYINDNNIQQKLNEISSIIDPEKFIQKHFGNEDPSEILFEKVLSPQTINSKKASTDKIITQQDTQKKDAHSKKQSQNNIGKLKTAILEEDIESSPDRKATQLELNSGNFDKSPANSKQNKKQIKNRQSKESARQHTIKNAKNVINPPDSSLYTVCQIYPNQGPRLLKMADYFKDKSFLQKANDQNINDKDQNIEGKLLFNDNELQQNVMDNDDIISLNEQEKDTLKQKMKQDILNNIDINFLFNKGDQLRFGLIDQQKAYKLMMKIKDVANEQLQKGSKQIDYNEIVKYLQEEELYDDEESLKAKQDQELHPNSEPIKSKVPNKEPFTQEKWAQVVDFMRKNPKLLMQMLPDETEEDDSLNQQQAKSKNKVMQQIEDAKRWSKLQQLSKNFIQKRDLLEAIDNQQNYRLPSPTKNIAKDKKSLNSKQQTKNQQNDKQNKIKSPSNLKSQDIVNSGSDSEAQPVQNQPKGLQKQFQYNSVNNAKNIYKNPAYIHPDVNMTPSNQIQINSNRPFQSQQQTRVKSQIKIKKNSVMSTTMGDNTTLGTTATGHITNLNQYRINNLVGSQNQTIDDANQNVGIMSMLQNYNQNEIINNGGNGSHRRPITASAAQYHGQNKHQGYMKPVLQNRQDSFDMTNKTVKYSRAGSISKHSYNKRQLADPNDIGNQSAIQNYYSQHGQIEILSGSNNLNQSFGGGSIIGQKFAPINLGPSRLTQKYINKIAPSLKENEIYPKIMNKPRGNSQNHNSQTFIQRKISNIEQVITPSHASHMPLLNKRSVADYQRQRSDILNQSASNVSTKNNLENNDAYQQTPQGAFPKFVKPNALNKSQYSRKDSNNELNESLSNLSANNQASQYQKFVKPNKHLVNQNMQTRIGGIHNKLLISPQTGLTDPFSHTDDLKQDSQMSDKFSKKYLKLPIVDWAYTQLFNKVLNQDYEFNKEQDISIYLEKEVDYVIDMMKNKYKDFKRSDIMRPFYLKALQTVQSLLIEQGLQTLFEKMSKKYKEITIENTMKLLIRGKLAFHSRGMLVEILSQLINYELKAVQLKQIIDKHSKYRIPQEEYDEIQKCSSVVFEQGHELLVKIQTLRTVHKQFKTPFIFKKKDYINYVKSEMNEIKKLISIFKVQGINGPTEQDDLNKFLNIHAENNDLNQIEENKHETEEQSYYSTDNQDHNNINQDE